MRNEERDQTLYRYPNSNVLRNKLDIETQQALQEAERLLVAQRLREGAPTGQFNLEHLQTIHKHLFQDVYEWAGEIRQTDIAKTSWFHPHGRIELGMADIHKRLSSDQFLRGLNKDKFAAQAAEYIGDVNRLHPFREGNGRTQFQFLKQLTEKAGHSIDLTRFEKESWIEASIKANDFDTDPMRNCIKRAMPDITRTVTLADADAREAKIQKNRPRDRTRSR